MPAPEHLHPILAVLGDGGTVDMAERVHQLIAAAEAGRGVPPVAEAFAAGKTYIIRAKDYGAADDLAPQLAALHERTGAEFVVFDVDLEISIDEAASPTPTPTVTFHADNVSELIGQLIGACSSTRFWDELPTNYPYGAGTFQDHAGTALYEAAIAEYARITSEPDDGQDAFTEALRMETAENQRAAEPSIHDLIERSSLGTPDAKAARDRVPLDVAQEAVRRARADYEQAKTDARTQLAELERDTAARRAALRSCPRWGDHLVTSPDVNPGDTMEIDDTPGTVTTCPDCSIGLIHQPDATPEPLTVQEHNPATGGALPPLPDSAYPASAQPITDKATNAAAGRMHSCTTSDGFRIGCICSTGRDHGEEEMDLPAAEQAAPAADDIDWDDDPQSESTPGHAPQPTLNPGDVLPGTGGTVTVAEAVARVDAAPRTPATNAEIRAWCLTNGVPVSARGAVQKSARDAYNAAHPEA